MVFSKEMSAWAGCEGKARAQVPRMKASVWVRRIVVAMEWGTSRG